MGEFMELVKKYHSLALFCLYLGVASFTAPTYIKALSITLLFGYIAVSFFFQYKDLPDIRKETDKAISDLKAHYESELAKAQKDYGQAIKTLESEMKEVKTRVSAKSVGMSQTSVRF